MCPVCMCEPGTASVTWSTSLGILRLGFIYKLRTNWAAKTSPAPAEGKRGQRQRQAQKGIADTYVRLFDVALVWG